MPTKTNKSKPKLNIAIRSLDWEVSRLKRFIAEWKKELNPHFQIHFIIFTKATDEAAISVALHESASIHVATESEAYSFSEQFNYFFREARRNKAFTLFVSHGVKITGKAIATAVEQMRAEKLLTYSFAIHGMHYKENLRSPRPGMLGYNTCMIYSPEAVGLVEDLPKIVDNGYMSKVRVRLPDLSREWVTAGGVEETWLVCAMAQALMAKGTSPEGKFLFDARTTLPMRAKTTTKLEKESKRGSKAFDIKMWRKLHMAQIYLAIWDISEGTYMSLWRILLPERF